jgi:hypothetical protein
MNPFVWNIVPIICVGAAAILGFYDKNIWGWFLLVGALTAVVPSNSKDD